MISHEAAVTAPAAVPPRAQREAASAGRHGARRWRAPTVCAVGLLAQFPFLATHFHSGPVVAALGGADVSRIVGPAAPALLHWLIARHGTTHVPDRTILGPACGEGSAGTGGGGGRPHSDTGAGTTAPGGPRT